MSLENFDLRLIRLAKDFFMPIARFGFFVVFFWFGILKVIGLSPASGLVQRLFESSIHFMSFDLFIVLFGVFECLIGVLFLIKGMERIVILLLFIHMIMTFGPLVLLRGETWSGIMVPTLEGQYIIKNVVLIAAAIGIAANLSPLIKRPLSEINSENKNLKV